MAAQQLIEHALRSAQALFVYVHIAAGYRYSRENFDIWFGYHEWQVVALLGRHPC